MAQALQVRPIGEEVSKERKVNSRMHIRRLQTGIPGLDQLLGGGIPEFSFNLITGPPGSGKTTLGHQIMFSLASPTRRALFFTVLGELPLKMLRYQQQFPFFDVDKLNDSVRFCNLSADLLDENFDLTLAKIPEQVREFSPGLEFVDSFRSVARSTWNDERGGSAPQRFVQKLGAAMTGWLATTFLIGKLFRGSRVGPGIDGRRWHRGPVAGGAPRRHGPQDSGLEDARPSAKPRTAYLSHHRVLTQVTQARAAATSMQVTPEVLNDPAAFAKFQAAQGALSGALSRLLAVSENYPNLKADANFRDLQAQLEGTENRITVARNPYIASVQAFNVTVRSFPTNLTAMATGYKPKPNFSVENEKAIPSPPNVNFESSPAKPSSKSKGAAK